MTLAILAVAGVASISLFALKGILDQVPDVINSASRARAAWRRFKASGDQPLSSPGQVTQLPSGPTDDEEQPPAAA